MRQKLNENPIAQIALVGVLIAAAGLLLLTRMGGGASEGAVPAAATPPATETAPAPVTEAAPAPTTDPMAAPAVPTAAPAVPTPRLPVPVASAYDTGATVVLLIVRAGGIDDRRVAQAVRSLGAVPGVASFVVRAKEIARYAAMTQGLGVDRVPALVVVRPKELTGGVPQGSVTYGFTTPQSIVQAVRDAQYAGPAATYQPG